MKPVYIFAFPEKRIFEAFRDFWAAYDALKEWAEALDYSIDGEPHDLEAGKLVYIADDSIIAFAKQVVIK